MKGKQTQYGTGRYNRPFHDLRIRKGITQEKLADIIGYNSHTIIRIEQGYCGGKLDFWRAVKKALKIPAGDMWYYMNGEIKPDAEWMYQDNEENENFGFFICSNCGAWVEHPEGHLYCHKCGMKMQEAKQ